MSNRIKFYGKADMANGYMLGKALPILQQLKLSKEYVNINDIIELYNVQKFIHAQIFRKDFKSDEKALFNEQNSKIINQIVGRFFSKVDDGTIANYFGKIERGYTKDALELLEKYNVHKRISWDSFKHFIDSNHIPVFYIVECEKIVNTFDNNIRELILKDNQSIDLLITKYLKRSPVRQVFLPKSLSLEDKEQIVKNYIDSAIVHPGTLEIIINLPIDSDFKISDDTRLAAKNRYDQEMNNIFAKSGNSGFQTTIESEINNKQKEPVIIDYKENRFYISVSSKWIRDNLDYPTLLNNFIHIYNFVDKENRIEFISKPNHTSTLEKVFMNTDLKKIYVKSSFFDVYNSFAVIAMISYCEFLEKDCNIRIEEVLQWFFDEYLVNESNIHDFIVNMPSSGSTYLEKCRTICCEFESVLKQYEVLVKFGTVNHDFIELSSKPMDYHTINSLIPDKYIYLNENNQDCQNTLYWLFSDQTMLTYLPHRKDDEEYNCLYELLMNTTVNISEYEEYQRNGIKWLITKGILKQDSQGNLALHDKLEAIILCDLYKNGFVSNQFLERFQLNKPLKNLQQKCWIYNESSLFAKQECDYLDFYLNKSKFTNGQDLRNTYLHGTQRKRGADIDLHRVNYYRLLMFVVMAIIKINEELCYKAEHAETKEE